jgi:hypothetical protein
MLSNSTKVVSHTSIINLGTTVHLKLISVVDLNLGQNCQSFQFFTYRRKLMAEIYLAILVVYHDLTLLLYY